MPIGVLCRQQACFELGSRDLDGNVAGHVHHAAHGDVGIEQCLVSGCLQVHQKARAAGGFAFGLCRCADLDAVRGADSLDLLQVGVVVLARHGQNVGTLSANTHFDQAFLGSGINAKGFVQRGLDQLRLVCRSFGQAAITQGAGRESQFATFGGAGHGLHLPQVG